MMKTSLRTIILMGVSGSGKTTIGRLLAERLGWEFVDADDFHSTENIAKMKRGEALTDVDRVPWLAALARMLSERMAKGASVVLACSALKAAYREVLMISPWVRFCFLDGEPDLIARRLAKRPGHFMPPALLGSQFATLEVPREAFRVNIDASPEEIVANIRALMEAFSRTPLPYENRN